MEKSSPRGKRTINSYSARDTVRVTLPYPQPGGVAEVEFQKFGLRVLVERIQQETEEQVRARFVVTAPIGTDNRTHAARLGTGTVNPKKLGVTLCTEEAAAPRASGIRITGLTLESVTCGRCQARLGREGVQITSSTPAEEGSES